MNERRFTRADQEAFAALSGDWNPIHVDPVAARRLLFGEPVVHGVHLLLWALDRMALDGCGRLGLMRVKATFLAPVLLDRSVLLAIRSSDADHLDADIYADEQLAAVVSATLGTLSPSLASPPDPALRTASHARPLSIEAVAQAVGSVPLELDAELLRHRFPGLSSTADPCQIAVILATTRIVGMECPGLHSLFSELDLVFRPGVDTHLSYRTSACHPELRVAEITVEGEAVSGKLMAFVRPEPARQLTLAAAAQHVGPDRFAHVRALVIGGSRGLGEVTAKLLAAGGAAVALTYRSGRADADSVAAEILSFGATASVHPFDVQVRSAKLPDGPFTHMYYFASPKIRQGPKVGFDEALFAQYAETFVFGFERCTRALQRPISVLYPSTIFVEQPENRFAEYAAAKAAGEAVCRHLGATPVERRVEAVRFPRLHTDQNLGLVGSSGADPLQAVLAALDKIR